MSGTELCGELLDMLLEPVETQLELEDPLDAVEVDALVLREVLDQTKPSDVKIGRASCRERV